MLTLPLLIVALLTADLRDQTPTASVIALSRGSSQLLNVPSDVTRVAISDPDVANVVVVSPREVLINAAALGSTTLTVWDEAGVLRTHSIEVSVDVAALNRQFATLFPGEAIQATAHGDIVVLSGAVSGAAVALRILELARGTNATVITNFYCVRPSTTC